MSKKQQLGCKKCGAVLTVEIQPWSERLDVKVIDGKVHDKFGTIELLCKKCNNQVATILIKQS